MAVMIPSIPSCRATSRQLEHLPRLARHVDGLEQLGHFLAGHGGSFSCSRHMLTSSVSRRPRPAARERRLRFAALVARDGEGGEADAARGISFQPFGSFQVNCGRACGVAMPAVSRAVAGWSFGRDRP